LFLECLDFLLLFDDAVGPDVGLGGQIGLGLESKRFEFAVVEGLLLVCVCVRVAEGVLLAVLAFLVVLEFVPVVLSLEVHVHKVAVDLALFEQLLVVLGLKAFLQLAALGQPLLVLVELHEFFVLFVLPAFVDARREERAGQADHVVSVVARCPALEVCDAVLVLLELDLVKRSIRSKKFVFLRFNCLVLLDGRHHALGVLILFYGMFVDKRFYRRFVVFWLGNHLVFQAFDDRVVAFVFVGELALARVAERLRVVQERIVENHGVKAGLAHGAVVAVAAYRLPGVSVPGLPRVLEGLAQHARVFSALLNFFADLV